MKLCALHWRSLQLEIQRAGMWAEVANKEAPACTLVEVLENVPRKFDPAIEAQLVLYSHAIKVGGQYLMGPNEFGGEYCPVCEAVQRDFEGWIETAVQHVDLRRQALLVD